MNIPKYTFGTAEEQIIYTSHATYFRAELTFLWPSEFYTTVNADYN